MPEEHKKNTDPKDENKELETTVNHPQESVTVTEEPPVREITQTDRINKRLLVSLLENMNKNQFFDMGSPTATDAADSPETDADWK